MSSPANYGSLPPSSAAADDDDSATIFTSRARTATRTSFFATRGSWSELCNLTSFSLPISVAESFIRLKRNLNYFRVNYTLIILLILFLSLIWHPVSMIVFIVIFILWLFLYFFRDQPLTLFNFAIDDRFVLTVLGVLTVVALVLTNVWLNVLVSLLIGCSLVCLHGALRGTEDLYNDDDMEGGGNGLFSVVGDSTRSGYTSIF